MLNLSNSVTYLTLDNLCKQVDAKLFASHPAQHSLRCQLMAASIAIHSFMSCYSTTEMFAEHLDDCEMYCGAPEVVEAFGYTNPWTQFEWSMDV